MCKLLVFNGRDLLKVNTFCVCVCVCVCVCEGGREKIFHLKTLSVAKFTQCRWQMNELRVWKVCRRD
jgi:predicted nucleic acid-binding Zn finger protein